MLSERLSESQPFISRILSPKPLYRRAMAPASAISHYGASQVPGSAAQSGSLRVYTPSEDKRMGNFLSISRIVAQKQEEQACSGT